MHDNDHITIDAEFSALIPALSDEELALLEASVRAEGCRDALTAWRHDDGLTLLDGHNRYSICRRHGIPFVVNELEFETRGAATAWMIRNQLGRRNISAFVRAELALKLKPVLAEEARGRMLAGVKSVDPDPVQNSAQGSERTRNLIADAAQVSHDTINKVERIVSDAPRPVYEAARRGDISIHRASELTKALKDAEPEIVQAVVEQAASHGWDSAGTGRMVREVQQQRRVEALEDKRASLSNVQPGTYRVIYADPPWRYEHSTDDGRRIENHYPTLSLDEICALPIADMAAEDSVLFMWATSPKLAEAMRVVDAWGFNYRTCMVWVKDKIGMGYYARQRHELLLIAVRGQPPVPEPSVRPDSVQEYPRGRHSEKPELFYGLIEGMYPGWPRVELFARAPREGWAQWGNEVPA